MFRKIVYVLIAAALCFNLAACGSSDADSLKDDGAAGVSQEKSKVTPEFKRVLDDYEAFVDEYLIYLIDTPEDVSPEELTKIIEECEVKAEKLATAMEAFDDEKLTDADRQYYEEVQARILEKYPQIQG